MNEKKIVMKVTQEEYDRLMKQTKCWSCANACTGGCNWSKRFQPVKGWKADKRKVENKASKYVTYFVHSCPQYDCDVVLIKPKPKPVPETVPAKPAAKKPKPKPANVKRGTKGTHIYMMMRNGMFELFDSINDVSTYIKEHDDIEMKMSSVRNRICEALKASPKRYFYCCGHMFKRYEE